MVLDVEVQIGIDPNLKFKSCCVQICGNDD